jgi:hypothetical protein
VWIGVKDAAGAQLFQKELALNESYTVPATATGAVLTTARPDLLRVTVGTRDLGPLRPRQEVLRGQPLDPAALMAPPAAATGTAAAAPVRESSTVSAE